MRFIKAYSPDYLYMPLDQAPTAFWKLAFPMPFRTSIDRYSRNQSLDPFLISALIRQESEFNVHVISSSNAYGLMQVLPSNGRQLARHFGVRRLNARQLLTVDRNLQLGTYYFRNMLNTYGGPPSSLRSLPTTLDRAVPTYGAPGDRSASKRSSSKLSFYETRGYIQIVLRNADVYQRLYGGRVPNIPAYRPKPAPKKKKKPRHRPSV